MDATQVSLVFVRIILVSLCLEDWMSFCGVSNSNRQEAEQATSDETKQNLGVLWYHLSQTSENCSLPITRIWYLVHDADKENKSVVQVGIILTWMLINHHYEEANDRSLTKNVCAACVRIRVIDVHEHWQYFNYLFYITPISFWECQISHELIFAGYMAVDVGLPRQIRRRTSSGFVR